MQRFEELVNEVLTVLRKLPEVGMTLVIVTHKMRSAREIASQPNFMHH